jgi:ribosomal-protein-alanine N-acetyltransferase
MNADPRVMQYFPAPLTRAESDAFVARIRQHFASHGFGTWAVEAVNEGALIGFTGLSHPRFQAHFTPCVETGWRLAADYWGKGYATEAADAALRFGFEQLSLSQIVSFASSANRRSLRVMEKLGLRHNPADDFDHPNLPQGHPLQRQLLYRIDRTDYLLRHSTPTRDVLGAFPGPTNRLFFRTWHSEDLPLAIAVWGDIRVTALVGGPFDEDKVRERLQAEIGRQAQHQVQYWPIFLKDSGKHVGCSGLRPYHLSRGIFEIGFYIRPEHWGQGFATESARAVLKFAFEIIGAAGLFAGHHPQNFGSKGALEKLGFRYTHDELYPPTGLQHRSYLLTLTEYRNSSPAASPDPSAHPNQHPGSEN